MKSRYVLCLTALALAAASCSKGSDAELSAKEVPEAVQAAVKATFPKAVVKEYSKVADEPGGLIEAELVIAEAGTTRRVDLVLAPDGRITETRYTIELKDAPEAARKAFAAEPEGKADLEKVKRIEKAGAEANPLFQFRVEDKAGKELRLLFDAAGKLISRK